MNETLVNQSYPLALEIIFYIGFFIAFAVKLPIIPLHTWLPDTHGEAHYSTCMLLAGILFKMGAYGLVRINMEPQPTPCSFSIFSLVNNNGHNTNNLCSFNISRTT
jgi:NAD(P)H-quinone oxidoreductase subunit 4